MPGTREIQTSTSTAMPLHAACSSGPGNLPVFRTSLVGRAHAVDQLVRTLRVERLVTVTGTAGVGKTRLAVEVATRLAPGLTGGAWFIDLSTVPAGGDVLRAVADALHLRESRRQALAEAVLARLRAEPALLVLDNCEHVLGACAGGCDLLLRSCPDLRLILTSREVIRLDGEVVLRLTGLSLSRHDDDPDWRPPAPSDAVQLFVDRSAAQGVRFEVPLDSAVAEICRRLDGIPLAIELAAARTSTLTPREIAERLDERLAILTQGRRDAPARHRTLEAALKWGDQLLDEAERILLARLSVFVGGWTVAAAEAIAAGSPIEAERVLDLLSGLVEKSLVVRDSGPQGSRFRLLETIREHNAARLREVGEETAVRRAHVAWCLALVEEAQPGLTGPDQPAWLARLAEEEANLRAALGWALGGADATQGARLASGLALYWVVRGPLSEAREWFERALAADLDPRERARAMWGAGLVAFALGECKRARAIGEEAVALAREHADDCSVARALNLLGGAYLYQDLGSAAPVLEESVTLARRIGDTWCLASSLGYLGYGEVFRGRLGQAVPAFSECVAVARASGDQQGLRIGLLGLGWVRLHRGEYVAARQCLEEGLAMARALDDPFWLSVGLGYLGELTRLQGEPAAARRHLEEALALVRPMRSRGMLAFCLSFLGWALLDEGCVTEAADVFTQVVSLPGAAGMTGNVARAQLGLGCIALSLGQPHAARGRLDQALALARESGERTVETWALVALARCWRWQSRSRRAFAASLTALEASVEATQAQSLVTSIELLAGVSLDEGRSHQAARLFAGAEALRAARELPRALADEAGHEADRALLEKTLEPGELEELRGQGEALSPDGLVAYAKRGYGRQHRATVGWDSLSRTEAEVVRLAAAGRTNKEIGAQLFVSPRTIQTHLAHAYAKLGLHSRRQLAAEVLRSEG